MISKCVVVWRCMVFCLEIQHWLTLERERPQEMESQISSPWRQPLSDKHTAHLPPSLHAYTPSQYNTSLITTHCCHGNSTSPWIWKVSSFDLMIPLNLQVQCKGRFTKWYRSLHCINSQNTIKIFSYFLTIRCKNPMQRNTRIESDSVLVSHCNATSVNAKVTQCNALCNIIILLWTVLNSPWGSLHTLHVIAGTRQLYNVKYMLWILFKTCAYFIF